MNIDEITQASLLYDFYGQLLSRRQKECMELYYEENLSLSEIADEFGISRQGVSDALRNAVRALNEYERKLGLVEKLQKTNQAIAEIDSIIDGVAAGMIQETGQESAQVVAELKRVKDIIDKLEE